VGISVRNFLGEEYGIGEKMWFLSSFGDVDLAGFAHKIRVGDVIFDMENPENYFQKLIFFFLQKFN